MPLPQQFISKKEMHKTLYKFKAEKEQIQAKE